MIREIRETVFREQEPQECNAFRQGAEALINEYHEAIAQCCGDADTICFSNQSVRAIIAGYAERTCRLLEFQPDPLAQRFGRSVEIVYARMRQLMEEMLAPCFGGEIPR